ncbi:DUF1295 domain-containing protein [Ancylobacter sp. WKF20]|uniref:DUF1295 domain-containing protein n=1 Tax=Ancylobacter sp. WKF20 TaxID=3039801 RepID=UPI0024342306|nr:DUF1295 domain-containing protein [Ancylobacter sp. WKF20]WGD29318.1 DUF1295 domain-containing protein [Ancylobacter sp. WKF20]
MAGTLALLLLAALGVMALAMTLAWVLARRTGSHGWVDTVWSFAVGLTAVTLALLPLTPESPTLRQIVVAAAAGLWSLRLGSHILARTLKGGDDPRYAELVREWGPSAPSRLFLFLQIQAVCGLILAGAVMAAAHAPMPFGSVWDILGLLVIVVAVAGEGLADRQLAAFRANPSNRGKVCDVGLWGVSRHPNYFFEWMAWVAYPLFAIDTGGDYLVGYAALAGPALMYWLLVHASGIPPTEAHMLRSRGDAFRAYMARVNSFWPGPPKKPGRGR